MSLSEKFYKGYGHSPVHLLNKCETCNKNRRESNAVTKFREALSFSAFLVIFFAFAICLYFNLRYRRNSLSVRFALREDRIALLPSVQNRTSENEGV